jgi:rod shape determining protein RodA
MVAWYFNERPLPPTFGNLLVALAIIGAPSALIAIQPDLGTGILVASAGLAVIVLAGLQWRWIGLAVLAGAAALPGLWYVMRDYQRDRVLTLFDPERDPLGAGWNIIQSTTAIGSGGVFGKGLFEGTQSHLDFLPEGTDRFHHRGGGRGTRTRGREHAAAAVSRDHRARVVHRHAGAADVRASDSRRIDPDVLRLRIC